MNKMKVTIKWDESLNRDWMNIYNLALCIREQTGMEVAENKEKMTIEIKKKKRTETKF